MNDINYFPSLRTRAAELQGLQELSEARKDRIKPVLTFGCVRKDQPTIKNTIERIQEVMGQRPYICDLTSDPVHLSDEMSPLKDPSSAYKNWRALMKEMQASTPCVISSKGGSNRNFVRQALLLEQEHGAVAFRIRDFRHDIAPVVAALDALDAPQNALVFIDPGYVANLFDEYVTLTIAAINKIREADSEIMICVLSSSFPASVIEYSQDETQSWGLIPTREHAFHQAIGGSAVAIYGDYGSIHAAMYDDAQIRRWSPRIDYPRLKETYFERRPLDGGAAPGYIASAKEILRMCPSIRRTNDIWGIQKIIEAANEDLFAKNPASWIAVRANIHMSTQIDYWHSLANGEPVDFSPEFREYDEEEL